MPGLLKNVDVLSSVMGKMLGHARGPGRRARTFVVIEPEASGSWSAGASAEAGSSRFDYWLGDDLVRAYPAVLVTAPLKVALQTLPRPTGFTVASARVEATGFYRGQQPGQAVAFVLGGRRPR